MADVSILDINGSQWNFKDTEARNLITKVSANIIKPTEVVVSNLNRCTVPAEWRSGVGFRTRFGNIISIKCKITANNYVYAYSGNTRIATFNNVVITTGLGTSNITFSGSAGGLVFSQSGNNLEIRTKSGVTTSFNNAIIEVIAQNILGW
jgi:hypothetical protein